MKTSGTIRSLAHFLTGDYGGSGNPLPVLEFFNLLSWRASLLESRGGEIEHVAWLFQIGSFFCWVFFSLFNLVFILLSGLATWDIKKTEVGCCHVFLICLMCFGCFEEGAEEGKASVLGFGCTCLGTLGWERCLMGGGRVLVELTSSFIIIICRKWQQALRKAGGKTKLCPTL